MHLDLLYKSEEHNQTLVTGRLSLRSRAQENVEIRYVPPKRESKSQRLKSFIQMLFGSLGLDFPQLTVWKKLQQHTDVASHLPFNFLIPVFTQSNWIYL